MGQEISTEDFAPEHYERFQRHLDAEMELLRSWFRGDKFCRDELQVGLELEAWLIGQDGRPVPDNTLFLNTLERHWVVPELSKFNFEVNVTPQYLKGSGLQDIRSEFTSTWQRCQEVASRLDHQIVSIGILPTVTNDMLCVENMSPLQRFAALNKQVLLLRGGSPLVLEVDGSDHLRTTHQDLMLESAATSIQVHLKTPIDKSVRAYNASLIASPFTVAAAANAPLLFGKRLWADTRITVFEQAVDTAGTFPRVSFGRGYVQESLLELFERNLRHRILLPAEMQQAPAKMPYVRLHNGTLWRWNRPLIGFEPDGRPHIRIEHRPMSASPSSADLFADIALYLGLVAMLSEQRSAPEFVLPFETARSNFYAAARNGYAATITWLDGRQYQLDNLLGDKLLDPAMDSLARWGADSKVVETARGIQRSRLESGQNGAAWQLRNLTDYDGDLAAMLCEYQKNQTTGQPVHTWS